MVEQLFDVFIDDLRAVQSCVFLGYVFEESAMIVRIGDGILKPLRACPDDLVRV